MSISKPYQKPHNVPVYVNKQSNHPPNIISQIPRNVNQHIPKLSSNKEIYSNVMPLCEKALKDSGFDDLFEYTPVDTSIIKHSNDKSEKR